MRMRIKNMARNHSTSEDRKSGARSGKCSGLLLFCAPAILLSSAMELIAQPANIRISRPGGYPEEVSIAINPKNPDNIIAGANLRHYFWSEDGGATWDQSQLPPGTHGDPCVIFDADGRAYYAHLTQGWDAITVRRSDDGGKTWSAGVKLRGPSSDSARAGSFYESSLQDKEWLCADITGSRFRGNIYASWTDFTRYGSQDPKDSSVIVFARSTDRGVTFEPFVRVSDHAGNAVDGDNTVEGAVPAVGPEGEVYISWAGPNGLYFDKSLDGGVTWGDDLVISDMPGGWDINIRGLSRANGLPITVCDVSSGPYRGNVYVNWVDLRNGDADVFIARSTDRGSTWSLPVRVNDDAPANGKEQFFTWAVVDPVTGELTVVYYDRRRYDGDSTDVYLARSADGGLTFSNECISEAAFFPTAMVFMGDYNCVAAYGGRIRPIWTRLHDGNLSIHTALIDDEPSGIFAPSEGEVVVFNAFPNPITLASSFSATVRIGSLPAGPVEVSLYDLIGRRAVVVYRGRIENGVLEHAIDARHLPAGQYICRLTASSRSGAGVITQNRLLTVLK